MKIKVTTQWHGHYLAICGECDFECALHSDTSKRDIVIREVRRHVRKTGHRVTIEKGSITHYEPEK